jgi:hypothetical protein
MVDIVFHVDDMERVSPVFCGSKDTKSIQNPNCWLVFRIASLHRHILSLYNSGAHNRHGSESINRQVVVFLVVTVSENEESIVPINDAESPP